MKGKFMEGATAKRPSRRKTGKDMDRLGSLCTYAFNKSHSTCYAFVAYQTAYLKAHYPAEYMAAVLTTAWAPLKRSPSSWKNVSAWAFRCLARMSTNRNGFFGVNKKGEIRFGLGGIKGVGDARRGNHH